MSNTLVSGQLALPTLPDSQISHLNSIRSRADSSASDNPGMQRMASNKRAAPVGSNTKGPILSPASNKKSMLNISTRASVAGKKVVQLESVVNKSPSSVSKKNAQPEVSPRSAEACDSVRAKLRESLASALALVSQQREGSSDGKMKTEDEAEVNSEQGIKEHKPLVCEPIGANNIEIVKAEEFGTSSNFDDGSNDDKKASPATHLKETCGEDTQAWNFMGTEFQSNPILSGEDSLFSDSLFFKDELLQGNGLSWVSDSNPHISELKEVETALMSEVKHEDVTIGEKEKIVQSPESLALEIESELFKLFDGVNKKYKEKARSLLFNLKDRNNPELRERVMSGEIPPDRLCSMTAEELASKELSQWRIAKAEELDHMKVLPEPDVSMRRLVKKTHKGEYQVDFNPDMDASEEISPNISLPSQKRLKTNGSEGRPPKGEPKQYDQCEITIPSDGTDMQGLMVDDVKDLPPIVSLDEFMESLNNEPPFDNLPVDSGTTTLETDKEKPELASKSESPVQIPKLPLNIASQKAEEFGAGSKITEVDKKLADSKKELKTPTIHPPKHEHIWEGLLQLSISSMANFVTLYISGEKASTKEWAGFFDIKGRVRLDAFDKFLQALPMSRSRAIMVSHFVLKEGSADSEHSSLLELVDSYITDERVGFAEPAPGVELYLCPPRTKTVEMIINHLPKSYTEKLSTIDDGLIGIVVWRKVQITQSVTSPDSLTHQKHTNKTHTGTQNAVNDDMNRNNLGFAPRNGPSPPILSKPPQPDDDDDDDVPPGFGPPGHRDDDDLPEFNFSGGHAAGPNMSTSLSNLNPNPNPAPGHGMGSRHHNLHRAPPRQVDQMRELIHKYGQNGSKGGGGGGIPIEPWNDDDDDIPEWQPQASLPVVPPPPPPQPIQNTQMVPHLAHYPSFQRPPWPPIAQPIQPLQPPMNVQQQGAWWPYGANNVGSLPSGQFNGASGSGHLARDWRTNNGGNNRGY